MNTPSRVALITGASRGIGRATAVALARQGTDIILTYLSDAKEGEAAVAEIQGTGARAAALRLDLGDTRSFDSFAGSLTAVLRAEWGRGNFDYLINNGGAQRPGSFGDITEDDFDALVNVLFKGTFFLTQKLAPLLADGGSIINISSGVTRFYTPQHFIYAACKGAIEVLTRYTAAELGPRRIKVNTIAPGATATDFMGGFLRDSEEIQKVVSSVTAFGRYGEPDDIGGAIAALLGDGTHWVTGQRIEVSGGQNL
jgi:NAD(P)-dependent dehydrogenase (short-subunit alcohol dehydrogenase family)